jgi:hypothetical protein
MHSLYLSNIFCELRRNGALGRPRHSWNIEMELLETGRKIADRIHMA